MTVRNSTLQNIGLIGTNRRFRLIAYWAAALTEDKYMFSPFLCDVIFFWVWKFSVYAGLYAEHLNYGEWIVWRHQC